MKEIIITKTYSNSEQTDVSGFNGIEQMKDLINSLYDNEHDFSFKCDRRYKLRIFNDEHNNFDMESTMEYYQNQYGKLKFTMADDIIEVQI